MGLLSLARAVYHADVPCVLVHGLRVNTKSIDDQQPSVWVKALVGQRWMEFKFREHLPKEGLPAWGPCCPAAFPDVAALLKKHGLTEAIAAPLPPALAAHAAPGPAARCTTHEHLHKYLRPAAQHPPLATAGVPPYSMAWRHLQVCACAVHSFAVRTRLPDSLRKVAKKISPANFLRRVPNNFTVNSGSGE